MNKVKAKRDNFSAAIKRKLAERAGYICSNPSCNRVTVGPVESDANKSSNVGIGAHICAASPGGPRYDMSQTPGQRTRIENGIWLCGTCASLIDKNNGADYPVDHLKKWKKDHEALIKECIEGNKRVVFQLHISSDDTKYAKQILNTIEDRGALYFPYQQENQKYVIDSLKELRSTLTAIRANLEIDSPIDLAAKSIVDACRYYMNSTSVDAGPDEVEFSLGAVRKIIGVNVGQIIGLYDLTTTHQIQDIIPK